MLCRKWVKKSQKCDTRFMKLATLGNTARLFFLRRERGFSNPGKNASWAISAPLSLSSIFLVGEARGNGGYLLELSKGLFYNQFTVLVIF